jgi:hypothetical protein
MDGISGGFVEASVGIRDSSSSIKGSPIGSVKGVVGAP